MVKVAVVLGSTREGRASDRVAAWVAAAYAGKADVEVIDLKDYPLPFINEAISPRYNPERQAEPAVQKWLDKVAQFDAYVLVTPEYNRAMSAVLKNALDVLAYEMEMKPVGLVAHGSTGGAQALDSLRSVVPAVGAFTVPAPVYFAHRAADVLTEDGVLNAEIAANPYGPQGSLNTQVEQVITFATKLAA